MRQRLQLLAYKPLPAARRFPKLNAERLNPLARISAVQRLMLLEHITIVCCVTSCSSVENEAKVIRVVDLRLQAEGLIDHSRG